MEMQKLHHDGVSVIEIARQLNTDRTKVRQFTLAQILSAVQAENPRGSLSERMSFGRQARTLGSRWIGASHEAPRDRFCYHRPESRNLFIADREGFGRTAKRPYLRRRRSIITTILDRQIPITGFDPRILLRSLRGTPAYIADWLRYSKLTSVPTFKIRLRYAKPMLTDRYASAGAASGHYFHQDLWAARKIHERGPAKHLDIGSRIDGFVAHVLTFMPLTIVDIRPMKSDIQGLTFLQDDATKLAKVPSNSVQSLSSLHVAEHFGLGRYSDPIDPEACFEFMRSLERVLAPGGRLYFSVPVGKERVEFNAHRVFSPKTILDTFSGLRLESFSYVSDDGDLYLDAVADVMPASTFACGLYEFTKT